MSEWKALWLKMIKMLQIKDIKYGENLAGLVKLPSQRTLPDKKNEQTNDDYGGTIKNSKKGRPERKSRPFVVKRLLN